MRQNDIAIKGARVNNLKNIDLSISLGEFIVITGVSGSGKSSLAFDTLYAEGQRRYVESLSAYARQFLGRMAKPECDYIKGLPPAIAIEQKVNMVNPRSTVGTSTEIYDYLRMLFARVGRTFSPISGEEVKKHGIDEIVKDVTSFPEDTRLAVFTNVHIPEGRSLAQQLEIYLKQGYSRIDIDGRIEYIEDLLTAGIAEDDADKRLLLLIDRLAVSTDKDEISRLTDSVETAYYEGFGQCIIKIWPDGGEPFEKIYSNKFESDGMEFRMPDDMMFNFNSPSGACPECEGFGKVMGISEDLVVPDKSKSIYQDAVVCWKGEKMSEWKRDLVRIATSIGFPIHAPYNQLTSEQLDILWHGRGSWPGIDGFFRWVDENQYKIQYRVMRARYRGKTLCPTCHGSRLRKDAEYVKIDGHTITELTRMPVDRLLSLMQNLTLNETDAKIASRLLTEINSRLRFLNDVGLGYLTLDRLSNTLSGGESQRINLATSLGSSLVGSMYVLDEPSIGLHPRDTARLIGVLKSLRNAGNTVIVVEHDEEIMRAADRIIDLGPDAGRLGGEITFNGTIEEALQGKGITNSHTIDYLQGRAEIPLPSHRRIWKKFIEVKDASENNLKDIDVRFPLGVMSVVTGVSGSGKSTLVRDVLYKGMQRHLGEAVESIGRFNSLEGNLADIKTVEFVDQHPIGTSSRSNPATYLKAFDEIRKLFAEQQLSRQLDFTPSYFSFNSDGGRCEECKGEGTVTIPMQFMADIKVECDECHGKRFKPEVLGVEYRGKNIHDMLEMTVAEAIDFLSETPGTSEKRIIRKLQPLMDVGLGYIKLGQSSSTLSGGENQRVKLAYFLSQEKQAHTLFIFDEPTTGLHFHDIKTLLNSLERLVDRGHTVVIIEHNLEVVKCADHVIDLGPEGGDEGGNVVAFGTPEEVAMSQESKTAPFLKKALGR